MPTMMIMITKITLCVRYHIVSYRFTKTTTAPDQRTAAPLYLACPHQKAGE